MSSSAGDVIEGKRTVPRCPNCRDVNGVYLHEGPDDSIFECIHCDQLFTFNPIGRRVSDDLLDSVAKLDVVPTDASPPAKLEEELRTTLNDAFDLLVDVGGALDEAIAARRLGPGQKRSEQASIRSCRFLAETVQRFPWLAGERNRGSIHDVPGETKPKPRETTSIYDVPEDRAVLSAIHRATNPQLRARPLTVTKPPRDERIGEIMELLRIQSEGDASGRLPNEGQTLDRIANVCLSKEGTCDECGAAGLVVFTNPSASHRRCATQCKQIREEAGKQRSKEAESGSGASELPSFRASAPEPRGRP